MLLTTGPGSLLVAQTAQQTEPQPRVAERPADSARPQQAQATNSLAAIDSITIRELDSLVRKLADDSFEGRESGSRGGRASGNMLMEYFERSGLTPMGDRDGWFQEFDAGYRNILGFISGSDPELRNEFIMIGAHYDHVGYGTPRNSFGPTGYIHNGADDNASGTAALMEIMQAVSRLEPKPARSVIFALWDAEEKGLLGSKDWTQNKLVDPSRIKLYINMDMVGRLRKEKLEVFGIRSTTGLRRLVSEENTDGIDLEFNWRMRDDSDHHSFWQKNVPSIMLHTGLHDQYHRPSDDVETLNFDGILKVARLGFRTTVAAANATEMADFRRESWTEGEAARLRFETAITNQPGRLGVRVNDTATRDAVQVAAVYANTPALDARLQPGDRIVSINGTVVTDRQRMMRLVRRAPQQSEFEIIRAGSSQPIMQTITLRGNPARIGLSWRIDEADPSIVLVVRVDEATPAGDAGVQVGDRIYEANGRQFKDSEALSEILKNAASPIELKLENHGRIRSVRLQLDD